MEGSGLLFVILLSFINCGLPAADEYGLMVNLEHVTVNVGDKPEFLCSTTKQAPFLFTSPLQWVQVGRDNKETVISSLGTITPAAKDDFNVELIQGVGDSQMAFKLTFKQGIKNSYDGYFKCRIFSNDKTLASKTVEVHVIRMMEKMSFSFGGTKLEETGLAAYPKRVKEGTYSALCKVERSNPKADVKIFLDNDEQTVTTTSMEDTSVTDPPQAFNVQSVVNLAVNPMHRDKKLKCVAMVNNDPTMKREIQFKLEVYSVSPEIYCSNRTAVDGDKYVDMECFITLPGITCSDQIIWENGDTGEQYYKTEGDTGSAQYVVSCQAVTEKPNTVRTVFRITQVNEKDFKTEYFVVYKNKYGTSKKEPVILAQDFNSASSLQYGIYLVCSMFVAIFLL